MDRLQAGLREILPEIAKRGFEKTCLCWYNETPTGDFIFDYHPEYKNLFIATGGTGQYVSPIISSCTLNIEDKE
jgi:sarcosine oxidase/L-pipecolate oxidase